MSRSSGSGHVPALDGLRAVAVLAVMANHAGLPMTQGGYLGVDVFFVLSGFLITGLLLHERDRTGRIHLGRFYMRRVLRLYPALITAVLLGLALAALGVAREGVLTHALIALAYLQDLAVSYGWSHQLGPWNHTWSLAVEEHFYLLWPLLLIALRRRRRTTIAVVAAVLAVLGFVYMQAGFASTASPTSAIYYHPIARSAALLTGCCLAALPPVRVPSRALPVAMTVLVATLALSPQANTRVAYAVAMPVVWAATGVLLLGARTTGPVTRSLSHPVAVWIGTVSYGLYLFHPLVISAVTETGLRRIEAAPLAIVLTFAVAAASYRWVERPFLRLKRRWSASPDPSPAGADALRSAA